MMLSLINIAMKKYTLLYLLLIGVLISGCSSSKQTLPYFADAAKDVDGHLVQMSYLPKIAPDDELSISVTSVDPAATAAYNLPEVNPSTRSSLGATSTPRTQTYVVDSEGYINMPVIGRIHVAGKNVEQLRDELTAEISRKARNPHVTVTMSSFTVSVAGEVRNPQTIRVPRNRISIVEALAEAGDLTEYGDRSSVMLVRETPQGRVYTHLDLNKIETLNSPYYYLQPNDYIYVAPNKVRQENSKYNQNSGFKLSIISTVVSACSVVASLIIALAVK